MKKVWIPGSVLLFVMIAGVTGNVLRGNYLALLLVAGIVVAAALLFFGSQFRARLLLRGKTAEGVIRHYHNLVRRVPQADAAAAFLSSMAAAAYAEFPLAHAELDAVQWQDKPAMNRSQHRYALGLLALMEDRDPASALQLAREGRELDREGELQVVCHVIETAAGGETPEGLLRLEAASKRRAGLIPALSLWALSLHYRRSGRVPEAEGCAALLRTMAPNCGSLVQNVGRS